MSGKVYETEIVGIGNYFQIFINEYSEFDSTRFFRRCGVAARFPDKFVVLDLTGKQVPILV